MGLFRRPDVAQPTVGGMAQLAARLAVFLRAGISHDTAWRELSSDPDLDLATQQLADAIASGLADHRRVREAVVQSCQGRGEPARVFAALVIVADESGTPLHSALWALAQSLRDRVATEADIRAVTTAPRQTAWLLMALPPLGLVVAWTLGIDVVTFFRETTLGRVAALTSGLLIGVAWMWMRRLVGQLLPDTGYLSPACDLLAVATAGGALPERALARVENALTQCGLDGEGIDAVQRLAELSRRVGVPISVLASTEAEWQRHRARSSSRDAAATLSVQILIPLGLLILPAFVLVGVLPVVVTLLRDAVAGGPSGLW